jgi:chromosome partitioning protein
MILAIAHHAGGVGKTTTTLNLGYALAQAGQRVLLVDMDPQGDLSARLGITNEQPILSAALFDPIVPMAKLVTSVEWGGVSLGIAASDRRMASTETALVTEQMREQRLRQLLGRGEAWDFVLIDCPPNLGLYTVNAFYAADGVLVPVQAQDKAYTALPLVLDSLTSVNRYRPQLGLTPLPIVGVLLTMAERNRMTGEVLSRLRTDYPDLLYDTIVRDRVQARYDGRYQAPIATYAPDSDVARDYAALAQEVLHRAQVPTATV